MFLSLPSDTPNAEQNPDYAQLCVEEKKSYGSTPLILKIFL